MSLKTYPVVLDLVRRLSPLIRVLRARSSALADQMERALISIPLNTAEGAYSRGKNRQARFQSAAASARDARLPRNRRGHGLHRGHGCGAARASEQGFRASMEFALHLEHGPEDRRAGRRGGVRLFCLVARLLRRAKQH